MPYLLREKMTLSGVEVGMDSEAVYIIILCISLDTLCTSFVKDL
jgi:hypothetical protein